MNMHKAPVCKFLKKESKDARGRQDAGKEGSMIVENADGTSNAVQTPISKQCAYEARGNRSSNNA